MNASFLTHDAATRRNRYTMSNVIRNGAMRFVTDNTICFVSCRLTAHFARKNLSARKQGCDREFFHEFVFRDKQRSLY